MRPDYDTLVQWIKPEPATEAELAAMSVLERGDYEIYNEKLNNFLAEAREVFSRTGVSPNLRAGDLIVGIYTPQGDMVSASCGTYLHAATAQLPIKFIMKNWLGNPTVGVREGDVFYANEALYGGIHNGDQITMMPVFNNGELIAWTAAAVHTPETGASDPASMPINAKTRHDEGMTLTPIKIAENYALKEDLMEMMLNFMSRAPRMHMLDLRARVSACDRLRVRLQAMASERGGRFVQRLFRKLIVEAEAAVRRKISNWNDGTYRAVVFTDTVGVSEGLMRYFVTLHKEGDHLLFDFAGTSPEHDGGSYHGLPHHMPAHAAVYLFAYAFHDVPVSSGAFAPMDWRVPPGSVFSPHPEAPVCNSVLACLVIMNLMHLLFARMLFDSGERSLVTAPNAAGAGLLYSGLNQYGLPYATALPIPMNAAGQGGRVTSDGVDAYGFVFAHAGRAADVEETEGEYPLLYLFQNWLPDSGGPGKWRGGAMPAVVASVYDTSSMAYTCIARDCRIQPAPGLFGGYAGCTKFGLEIRNTKLRQQLSANDKNLPRNMHELVTHRGIKGTYNIERNTRPMRLLDDGEVFFVSGAPGGGYGDVLQRAPELVMADLKKGLISPWAVRNVWHVAYEEETLEIDYQKTEELRRQERENRKRRGKRYQDFEKEWSQRHPPEEALKYYGSWPDGKVVRQVKRV